MRIWSLLLACAAVLAVASVSWAAEYRWFGNTDPLTAGWTIEAQNTAGTPLMGSFVADADSLKGTAWEVVKGPGQYLKLKLTQFPPNTPIVIDPAKGATVVFRVAVKNNGLDAISNKRRNVQITSNGVGRNSIGYWIIEKSAPWYLGEKVGMSCYSHPDGGSYDIPSCWTVPSGQWVYNYYWFEFFQVGGINHWKLWIRPNPYAAPTDWQIDRDGECDAAGALYDGIAFGAWDKDLDNGLTPDDYDQTLRWDYIYFTNDGHYGPLDGKGLPLSILLGPTVFASPSGTNARVDWQASEPTKGFVYYRKLGDAAWIEAPDPRNPEYRDVHLILLGASGTELLLNPGFEGGFTGGAGNRVGNNWTKWVGSGSPAFDYGFNTLGQAHSGSWGQKFGKADNAAFDCGLTQAVAVTAGDWYKVSGWVKFQATAGDAQVRLGYDTTGQTSNGAAASVIYTDLTSGGQNSWLYYEKVVQATGSSLALWARFNQSDQAGAGPNWCFADDFSIQKLTLTPDTVYEYYVKNQTATLTAVTDPQKFATWIYPDYTIKNGGAEAGVYSPWTAFGKQTGDQWIRHSGNWGIPARSGSYFAGVVAESDNSKDMDGLYQQVKTTPGQLCLVRGWVYTSQEGGQPTDLACRIGIDPTGGTDPGHFDQGPPVRWVDNPNIIWGPWKSTNSDWQQVMVGAWAQSTLATVFLQVHTPFALRYNKCAFDDVQVVTDYTPPTNIYAAKMAEDGAPVMIPMGRIVTASWPDENRFFIEEVDRNAGIQVITPASVPVPAIGKAAAVNGSMTTVGGERRIIAASVSSQDTTETVAPLGVNNVSLGGGQLGPQPAMTDRGAGIPNVGLLCQIWGRVLPKPDRPDQAEYAPGTSPGVPEYDPYGRYHMYIDDGSMVQADYVLYYDPVGGWNNLGRYGGVKVYYHKGADPYEAYPGDYVVCTGLAGIEMSDSNWTDPHGTQVYYRTLEVRFNNFQAGGPPYDYGDIIAWY